MEPSIRDHLKLSFDRAASEYARGRPTYALDAVDWLLTGSEAMPKPTLRVLDLAAGTGALTRQIARLVRSPVAVDPSHQMLAVLARRSTDIRCVEAVAEALPFRSRSFDMVTIGQSFHWLDHAVALPEIARVLRRPRGVLAVAYNDRDPSADWVRRFGELLVAAQPPGLVGDWGTGSLEFLEQSPHFGELRQHAVPHEQLVDRDDVVALAGSRSYVVRLADDDRRRLLADVGRIFDDAVSAGGSEVVSADPPQLVLGYTTYCWRAAVID